MLTIDHIVLSSTNLARDAAALEERLGVPLSEGGKHALFGTHNKLLRLGDLYLELIAIDPYAPKPERARWFALDDFSGDMRLTNWVMATEKPRRVIGKTLMGTGELITVSRGDLTWQITVPKSGKLPLDGFAPAIIDWMGAQTPTERLPDVGCSLEKFVVSHPHAISLRSFLSPLHSDPRVDVRGSEVPSFHATLKTPKGTVTLTS